MNKLPLDKPVQILSMLCEGSSMRAISRVTDVSFNTVAKLLGDAASIAARDDLNQTQRPYVEQMAAAQGVRFVRTNDGRLKPRAGHEHKLLEILDNRRFLSGLIGGAPVPFRARARQRVIVDL